MATPFIIVISLAGAAALGFLTAWFLQREKLAAQKAKLNETKAALDISNAAQQALLAEKEALKLSLDSLKKLLESYENQTLTLEEELLETKKICHELAAAVPEETVREIEVIREIPVLVYREINKSAMTREEKAAKLIKAFKKGVELEGKKAE